MEQAKVASYEILSSCLSRIEHDFFEAEAPKLEAIIYAEFDNDIGRVMRYQVSLPPSVLSVVIKK